ncbi:darcynin family protein [Burkholderia metallica]|uniref:darcynin family protein n=1 Tax=Burkholderia metallica TaxID=488729 RepID=UPI000D1A106A
MVTARTHCTALVETDGTRDSLRCNETPPDSAWTNDLRVRAAQDRHARERAVAALHETQPGDRRFDIAKILPTVENAHAPTTAARPRSPSAESMLRVRPVRESFFPPRPPEKTTVATCGTTVVVRDSTVTLWA